jgi:hypothetical protein
VRGLLIALLAAGCAPGEHAILIDVYTEADVGDLRVVVVSLDAPRTWLEPPQTIDRTAQDIHANPLRVAVELPAPSSVLVQIEANGVDEAGDPVRLVATRCYDVDGVARDEVLLVVLGSDPDGDGYVIDPATVCREPAIDEMPERACDPELDFVCPMARAADCDEGDPEIHPGAGTTCLDGVDDDCDGDIEEACADNDGDGAPSCPAEPTADCDCDDSVAQIHPGATDACNDRIDQDCDGVDACCDADMDGFVVCSFPTEAQQDCDDTSALAFPGGTEICDRLDNNCNGRRDELDECRGDDLDDDGFADCGRAPGPDCDCNDCDAAVHAGARERCNTIDEDCDGTVDEACPSPDADGDGYGPNDCRDDDPVAFPHLDGEPASDRCGDGMASTCVPGDPDTSCDADVEPPGCEGDASIVPGAPDPCDGIDNDCDGVVDEVLDASGSVGCGLGEQIVFADFFTDCGACRNACSLEVADACAAGACVCAAQAPGDAPCAAGTRCCSAGCVDVEDDPSHCGGCERACASGEMCVDGECRCGASPACDAGLTCCGGACVDRGSDVMNCGACGVACGVNASCSTGMCACGTGFADCDGAVGCEAATGTDEANCGRCGRACAPANATGECVGGICTIGACGPGFTDCNDSADDGCESNTTNDVANCGACGVVCGFGESCVSGQCVCGTVRVSGRAACTAPASNACCGGTCVDLMTDTAHCNDCNSPCFAENASSSCSMGACGIGTCFDGFADCDSDFRSCETDVRSSTSHCGACGNACGTGAGCFAGTCRCGMAGPVCNAPGVCLGTVNLICMGM